jgi:hypothetical protein
MARYRMLVLSRPTEGREAEYNDWYQNTHLKQIVAIPGFVSAQRFRLSVNMRGEGTYPYMAIYEIETDDVAAAYKALEKAAGDGSIAVSPAFDYDSVYASIYEPFGEAVAEST